MNFLTPLPSFSFPSRRASARLSGVFSAAAVAAVMALVPTTAEAATCVVDSSGQTPGSFPDFPSALSVCDGTMGLDELQIYCDPTSDPCEFEPFELIDQEIRLTVLPGSGHPTFYDGANGIRATRSTLQLVGDMKFAADAASAIEVLDSDLTLEGDTEYQVLFSNSNAALSVFGASKVRLTRVQLRDSYIGLQMGIDTAGAPMLAAGEVSFANNETAGIIDSYSAACGTPASAAPTRLQLDLGPGFQPNYVEHNGAGFILRGDAQMSAQHTMFMHNLDRGAPSPALIDATERSHFFGNNLVAFDNDEFFDPGQDIADWSTTTTASLLRIRDCATMEVHASTLAQNQTEYGVSALSTEPLRLYSSILFQSGRKGLDGSTGQFVSDGTTTIYGSFSNWDGCYVNFSGPIPQPSCPPPSGDLSIDPMLDASTVPSNSPYPAIMETLYLVGNPMEVGPLLVDDLFPPSAAWSTDNASRDSSRVDWGYHNLCTACP